MLLFCQLLVLACCVLNIPFIIKDPTQVMSWIAVIWNFGIFLILLTINERR